MKSLTYRATCDSKGKFLPWLNDLRNRSGVYVIRANGSHKILYVGECHTSALAKTVKRHFYAWSDEPERRHNVYSRYAVQVGTRITPPTTAVAAQDNLIRKLKPRDNGFVPVKNPF